MTSPKHLWTGDWEQESADAAAGRANRRPPAEVVEVLEGPEAAPKARPEPEAITRSRVVLLSLVALLLLAGAAYGVTALNRETRPPATGTPWLGAKLEVWPGGGALVTSVTSRSPAASAGLQPGDVIREVEGRPVAAPIDVTEAVDALRIGNALEIQFERNSKMYATSALLRARPANAP